TNITYTITLANNGPSDAQAVGLFDTLPAGTTFVSQNQTNGPPFALGNNGNAISDKITTLAAGGARAVSWVALVNPNVPDGTVLSNTAGAASTTTDVVPGNNSSTVTTNVIARADLNVVKTGPQTAIAGKTITYTVTLTNNGPSDAQGVALT